MTNRSLAHQPTSLLMMTIMGFYRTLREYSRPIQGSRIPRLRKPVRNHSEAQPGDTITAYGIGFGAVTPPSANPADPLCPRCWRFQQ